MPRRWGPRHSQSRGSRQGGPTSESFGCFRISRGTRGRCHLGQGPRRRQRTTRFRTTRHRTRGSDVGDRCRGCQAQVFRCHSCLRVIKHRNSLRVRGIRVGEASNPGPRDSLGSSVPSHRRLRLIRGGVESSAREVPLRAGSPVSPPSTVHASSRAVREVRGGEEDFLDGRGFVGLTW